MMPRIDGENYTQFERLNIRRQIFINGKPITTKIVLNGASVAANQQPTALDSPIQIEFGPSQTTDSIDLAADGTITIKQEQAFLINVWLQIGRTGAAGVSRLFVRAVLNGQNIPGIPPFIAEIDNANSVYTDQFRGNLQFKENDELAFELVRDSSGNNSGGLISATPALPDWPFAPCARLIISEIGTGEDA